MTDFMIFRRSWKSRSGGGEENILIFKHCHLILQKANSVDFKETLLPATNLSSLNYCCVVIKFCLILRDPMDYSPPDSCIHGIFPARILEWVAISFYRGSFRLRDRTCMSHIYSIEGRFFTAELPGKSL